MSWLETCPSGSVKLCLARSEIDYVGSQVKQPITHPVSIIELTWTVSAHPIYTFNIISWMVVGKDGSMGPSASPAGLISFEGNVSTGALQNVFPGPLDHYSLVTFLEKAKESYPHLSRGSLESLARMNAYEAAFDIATVVWTSVGGVWPILFKVGVTQSPIAGTQEIDIKEAFSQALEKSFKRLYRDVEVTNRPDVRSQLDTTAPAKAKRAKLALSRAPEERQTFSSNTENLFRAALLRCVRLPLTSTTMITPKKHKSSKKEKREAQEEDVDAGSGGFIRVAQLLSQLAPEAIHVNSGTHRIEFQGEMTERFAEPSQTTITSTSVAHFILAGQLCSVAHQSTYATWFMWAGSKSKLAQTLQWASEFNSATVVEKNHDFSREWTTGSLKPTELEWQARMSAIFSLWQSETSTGLSKKDIFNLLQFRFNRAPQEAEVADWMAKLDKNGGGIIEWKEFESWARLDASDELNLFSEFRCAVEHQDGSNWIPKLLIIDISSAHVYLYSQKALALLDNNPTRSSLKKMLKGSFDWKKHPHIGAGPTSDTLRFGKNAQDDSFVLKFKPATFKLVSKLTELLSSGGLAAPVSDNLLLHAFSAVDISLPALISLGECL